jgi:hypothetical protein
MAAVPQLVGEVNFPEKPIISAKIESFYPGAAFGLA